VAAAALSALRRSGVPATTLGVTAAGRTAVITAAHDLTADALRRRVAERPPDAPCDLRLLDSAEVDAQVGLPRPGERIVLGVGAVREEVGVRRGPDGAIAFVARAVVTMTVATAPHLPESLSAHVLDQIASSLASA